MPKEEKQRTTLYFPVELWKKTKIEAIRRGIDATDLVTEAVRAYLKKGGAK